MIKLWGVSADDLGAVWGQASALLARVSDSDRPLPDVKKCLQKGTSQLWVGWAGETITAALVTETYEFEGQTFCSLFLCAGSELGSWLHHLKTIEAWAKSNNCQICQLVGRGGWARILQPLGYYVYGRDFGKYIIRKEIEK